MTLKDPIPRPLTDDEFAQLVIWAAQKSYIRYVTDRWSSRSAWFREGQSDPIEWLAETSVTVPNTEFILMKLRTRDKFRDAERERIALACTPKPTLAKKSKDVSVGWRDCRTCHKLYPPSWKTRMTEEQRASERGKRENWCLCPRKQPQ